jgi:predicted DNA-binding antitoxin AbrB/MazE fold protein
MSKQVEAIYEKGMLRPLEPLELDENQHVTLTIVDSTGDPLCSYLDLGYVESIKKEVDAMEHVPSMEEVRALTSKDPASWAEAIIADREDRI